MKKIITTVVLSTFMMSSFMPSFVNAAETAQAVNIVPLGFVPEVDMAAQDLSKVSSKLEAVILKGSNPETNQTEVEKFEANHNKFVILSPDEGVVGLKNEKIDDALEEKPSLKEDPLKSQINKEVIDSYEAIKAKYSAHAIELRVPVLEDSAGVSMRIEQFDRNSLALAQVAKQSTTPFTQGYRIKIFPDPQIDLKKILQEFYSSAITRIIKLNYDETKLNDLYFNFAITAKDKKEFDESRKIIEEELLTMIKTEVKNFKDTDLEKLIAYTVLPTIGNKEEIKSGAKTGKVRFITEEQFYTAEQ